MAESDEWLTVTEVAQRLKLHQETIRRWIRDGKIRATNLGSTHAGYRIRTSDLELMMSRPFDRQQPELPVTKREPKKLAA